MVVTSVVLRIHYPTKFGDTIFVRGGGAGLSWEKGTAAEYVKPSESGYWELRLNNPDKHVEFKPVLNDITWGKGSNYILPSYGSIEIYPHFFSEHGHVETVYGWYSHILHNSRRINVYLPPSYHENMLKHYPVLFMCDGHNLFDGSESLSGHHWHLADCMNGLCTYSGIQETIVVGVVPVERVNEYLPTRMSHPQFGSGGGNADNYFRFLLTELKPYIKHKFRTEQPLEKVGIAGSSFGGGCALYGFLGFPKDFTVCGAFSPSLLWDGRIFFRLTENDKHERPSDARLYVDNGHPGDGFQTVGEYNEMVLRKIKTEGWLHESQYLHQTGWNHSHNEQAWAQRAPRAFAFMLHDPDRVHWER